MIYEYLILATNGEHNQKDVLQELLNQNGSDGWKVTNTIPSKNGTWLIMEKESDD